MSRESDEDDEVCNGESNDCNPQSGLLWKLLFFIMLRQSVFKVSNRAVKYLLAFLKYFIQVIGEFFNTPSIVNLSHKLPQTFTSAETLICNSKSDFTSFVVCPKCDSIYHPDDCIRNVFGVKESLQCLHQPNPNRRNKCNTVLLKKVKYGNSFKLMPKKAYPYYSLQKSLDRLSQSTNFIHICEDWRKRCTTSSQFLSMFDVYDGQVWHDFTCDKYGKFLHNPFCYLLTMNVDWFQPFTHTEYSIGAIYLTVQNLPRHLRYKEENIILIGIIPGPSEPSLSLNSYLTPFVEELMTGWTTGFVIHDKHGTALKARVALSCVACDIPASRKVCGFLSHNASQGCNKCLKSFLSISPGKLDYSEFDTETWPLRNLDEHRKYCNEILGATSAKEKKSLESKYGIRYSILLALPYFDPLRFTVIDPMHNLYLGTGKHVFKIWLKQEIINNNDLSKINDLASQFTCPAGVGRIPSKVSSNYGSFTAAQWKT